MRKLVAVSNRVSLPDSKKGRAGGLAVAIGEMLRGKEGIWFGWSGKIAPDRSGKLSLTRDGDITFATLDLARTDYAEYYNGFANRTLWPLLHLRLDLTQFDKQQYSSYLRVNNQFAQKLLPILPPDAPIWIHDYHLIPLAAELRSTIGNRPIGFFLHTPFPPLEVLAALPAHRALIRALCAYDVLGFQTKADLRAFHEYVIHEARGEVLGNGLVRAFDRTFRAEAFPIGIDTDYMIGLGQAAALEGRVSRLRERARGRTWIIGVDRLDYSKGIPQRFRALETLLEAHPEIKRWVTLMQIAPSSRAEVPEYMEIRRELEAAAGHVNGRFGEYDWMPIYYLNRSYTRAELAAFYRASRIGLVTPLRDGMNLVAKEYVAAQDENDPGVLVLSRFAGAAEELDAAVIVNPFDVAGTADAIGRALAMPLEERQERWRAMMKPLKANDLTVWCRRFLDALAQAPYGN